MILLALLFLSKVYCSQNLLFVNKYSGVKISDRNGTEVYRPVLPSIEHLNDLESALIKEYHRRVKRNSEFQGRRYVIYDRKPEEKKKKKKVIIFYDLYLLTLYSSPPPSFQICILDFN